MAGEPRGLELDDDMPAHRRGWVVQRIGWAGMLAVVAAGLLGVFGRGPASDAEISAGDVTVRYERFGRARSTSELRVVAAPGADGELRVWFGRDFMEAQRVDRVVPHPLRTVVSGDRHAFVFAVADRLPTTVVFHLEPERAGHHRAEVGVAETVARFDQYVWP